MKILALETSTELASLALRWNGECLVRQFRSPPAHSAHLLPAVREILAEAGFALSALDLIACGVGPGAFTGVRLACSVAQGLALGADLPVVPVCSLLALAEGSAAENVYCALDARMGEVYVAAYSRSLDQWEELVAPVCVAPEFAPELPAGEWQGAGNGFSAYPGLFDRLFPAGQISTGPAEPLATSLARLAEYLPACDPALLQPLYVRDRVALTVAERLAKGGRA